jgi:cobalamin biosynthesis protein CobT
MNAFVCPLLLSLAFSVAAAPASLAAEQSRADVPTAASVARPATTDGSNRDSAPIADPPANATPEAIYNAGVARFRAGDFASAGQLFARAAERANASTAARSIYNRGTSRYAEAIAAMQTGERGVAADAEPDGASTGAPNTEQVIASLEAALRDLKDAARADPSNVDARANAELAHRVLKQLKQQQQQQQQQNQDQQQQNQDQQQQQNQDQQQQNQDQQQQQNQDQQQQQQNQDQQQQQNRDQQQQQQNQDQQQQQQNQDQQQQQQSQDQQQQQPQQQSSAERKPMTKQEVERLLQKIRDRERQRVLDRLLRERARTQPAPKDW